MYVYVTVRLYATRVQCLQSPGRDCQIPWSWSCTKLWTAHHRRWELNSGPLREQCGLSSTEPVPQHFQQCSLVFSLNIYYSCAYPLNISTPITQQNTPDNKDHKRQGNTITRDAVQRPNDSLFCVSAYVLSLVICRETKVNLVKSLTAKCYVFSLNVFSYTSVYTVLSQCLNWVLHTLELLSCVADRHKQM